MTVTENEDGSLTVVIQLKSRPHSMWVWSSDDLKETFTFFRARTDKDGIGVEFPTGN